MGSFITHILFHSFWIVFSVFLATLSLFLGSLAAARYLHNDLLHKVMRAPMKWFDVTPAGRIINRISHDVSEIDNDLPATLRAWVSCIFSVFVQIQPNTTKHINESAYSFLHFLCDSFPIGCLTVFILILFRKRRFFCGDFFFFLPFILFNSISKLYGKSWFHWIWNSEILWHFYGWLFDSETFYFSFLSINLRTELNPSYLHEYFDFMIFLFFRCFSLIFFWIVCHIH